MFSSNYQVYNGFSRLKCNSYMNLVLSSWWSRYKLNEFFTSSNTWFFKLLSPLIFGVIVLIVFCLNFLFSLCLCVSKVNRRLSELVTLSDRSSSHDGISTPIASSQSSSISYRRHNSTVPTKKIVVDAGKLCVRVFGGPAPPALF